MFSPQSDHGSLASENHVNIFYLRHKTLQRYNTRLFKLARFQRWIGVGAEESACLLSVPGWPIFLSILPVALLCARPPDAPVANASLAQRLVQCPPVRRWNRPAVRLPPSRARAQPVSIVGPLDFVWLACV